MKQKCEDMGFVHAWEDATQREGAYYANGTPAFDARQKRICQNCGRIEVLVLKQEEIREWVQEINNDAK